MKDVSVDILIILIFLIPNTIWTVILTYDSHKIQKSLTDIQTKLRRMQ